MSIAKKPIGKRQEIKEKRRKAFLDLIKNDPFQTDEELADTLRVSVPTIRLDRIALSVPELRERIRGLAAQNRDKVRSLDAGDIIGNIVELELDGRGVSMLETDRGMVFEKTGIVRGHFIYAFAETLAIAVINEDAALVGVANIKYSVPVYAGSRLVARCELRNIKLIGVKRYFVWVKIYEKKTEVFRGKFILVSLDKNGAEAGIGI